MYFVMTKKIPKMPHGQEHSLKTNIVYWDAIKRGEKTFEIRRDDRGFQKGDILLLRKYDPEKGAYIENAPALEYTRFESNADTLEFQISYVFPGGQLGIEPGFVVLGIIPSGIRAMCEFCGEWDFAVNLRQGRYHRKCYMKHWIYEKRAKTIPTVD
jgi:hypothetical protein